MPFRVIATVLIALIAFIAICVLLYVVLKKRHALSEQNMADLTDDADRSLFRIIRRRKQLSERRSQDARDIRHADKYLGEQNEQ